MHLLRRQVVQAVRGGMSQTDAARIRSMIVGKVPIKDCPLGGIEAFMKGRFLATSEPFLFSKLSPAWKNRRRSWQYYMYATSWIGPSGLK